MIGLELLKKTPLAANAKRAKSHSELADISEPFLLVPVSLVQHAIENGLLPELRLFLLLKCRGNRLPHQQSFFNSLKGVLAYRDFKSVLRNFWNLQEIGWIDVDKKTDKFYLKSFTSLNQRLQLAGKVGAYIYESDLKHSERFRGLAAASVITRLTNAHRNKLRRLELIKECSREDRLNFRNGFYPVSIAALEAVFNCSKGQAFNLKKVAEKHGFIEVRKNYISTAVASRFLRHLSKAYPELSHRFIIKGGEVLIKDVDLVKGKVQLSLRNKK